MPNAVGPITYLTLAVLAVISVSNTVRLHRLTKRYSSLTKGADRKNIEDLLADCLRQLSETAASNEKLTQEYQLLRDGIAGCTQHVGVVRYQAFHDIGSDLSFSAAFLDAGYNGLVLTSIFGRDESRIYAKPIVNGTSTYALTEEEQTAIRHACSSKTLSRRVNKKGINLYE